MERTGESDRGFRNHRARPPFTKTLDFSASYMRLELEHLDSYDDSSLLDELRRVAALVHTPKLTIGQFTALAKVHGSTLQKRFGGWKGALEAAGLGKRYDDASIGKDRDDILRAIKATAEKLQKNVLTLQEFEAHAGYTGAPVRRVFGSWKAALVAAVLGQPSLGKRYTDEDCFENMLSLWTHYGRPPKHREMNHAPSVVGSKAYVLRWGTWRGALRAFVERANQDAPPPMQTQSDKTKDTIAPRLVRRSPRDIPLGLRYLVLRRDGNRCPLCGRSPQSEPPAEIHVDHIEPWALGGETVLENLRVLCRECNLGKGARSDEI